MKNMKPTGNDCLCTVCKRIFGGEQAFDLHRQGTFGIRRYCVDPASVGLVLNERGRWARPFPGISKAKTATISTGGMPRPYPRTKRAKIEGASPTTKEVNHE